MDCSQEAITLRELNGIVARLVTVPATSSRWVTAELSDVSRRGGHCYFELLEKDDGGVVVARARGAIWASQAARIIPKFESATGCSFTSGIKVMLQVSVAMHPVYGLSLVVSDIEPTYTMGDLERRRREILARLQAEGVLENNRTLHWPDIPTRIAVISSPKAAGFGDFINQLFHNQEHIRYEVKLFEAIMQGERAPASIIAAMDRIAAEDDRWDCVVIIRGGGATSDLQAFENYDLAASVANFPLPVVIGIGHERDITVLDWVANMRVKTPTAAAEWLIARAVSLLNALRSLSSKILQAATDRMSGAREQLSVLSGLLPVVPVASLEQARSRLSRAAVTLSVSSASRVIPAMERLNMLEKNLHSSVPLVVERAGKQLEHYSSMLDALSPQAVLRRGYSVTRLADGTIVQDAAQVEPGMRLVTALSSGEIVSIADGEIGG